MRVDNLLNQVNPPEALDLTAVFGLAGVMTAVVVPLMLIWAAFKFAHVSKYGKYGLKADIKTTRARKVKKAPAKPSGSPYVVPAAPSADFRRRVLTVDLIRGTALRLLEVGGGHEVVPVAKDASVRHTLPYVLDSILPAADRANCIVELEAVDAGVKVSVHSEVPQPRGIVHVSPTDPRMWEAGRS